MKFTKCRFRLSPGNPQNNPFMLSSWIIVPVILNFNPRANGGGIIAPVTPTPLESMSSSSSRSNYSTGCWCTLPLVYQIRFVGMTFSAQRLFRGSTNSSSSTLVTCLGILAFCWLSYAFSKASSLAASYCSTTLSIP